MPRYARLIIALVAGGTGVTSLVALGVGCGDDTAVPGPGDGSVDGTTADGTAAEGTAGDTGATPADGASETGNDGGAPGNGDAEGGAVVASPSPVGFSALISTAWCRSLERCCGLADAGTFDMQKCIDTVGDYNLSNDLATVPNGATDSGTVRYDQPSGDKCLSDIQALACGLLPSAALLTIRADCFAAIQGTIPLGATGCVTSLECAPQGFCSVTTDGGTRSCVPLAGPGGSCTGNEQCSYHASGQPALYCDVRFNDAGTHVCLAQGGVDASCGVTYPDYDQECTTDLCVAPGVCGTNNVFSDPGVAGGTCDRLTIKDAGGGG